MREKLLIISNNRDISVLNILRYLQYKYYKNFKHLGNDEIEEVEIRISNEVSEFKIGFLNDKIVSRKLIILSQYIYIPQMMAFGFFLLLKII